MLIRVLKTIFEDNTWLYAGQVYELPDDIAKEIIGSQLADAVQKKEKDAVVKISKRPRGRPRKLKRD